jgi:hypothetical protein
LTQSVLKKIIKRVSIRNENSVVCVPDNQLKSKTLITLTSGTNDQKRRKEKGNQSGKIGANRHSNDELTYIKVETIKLGHGEICKGDEKTSKQ